MSLRANEGSVAISSALETLAPDASAGVALSGFDKQVSTLLARTCYWCSLLRGIILDTRGR